MTPNPIIAAVTESGFLKTAGVGLSGLAAYRIWLQDWILICTVAVCTVHFAGICFRLVVCGRCPRRTCAGCYLFRAGLASRKTTP